MIFTAVACVVVFLGFAVTYGLNREKITGWLKVVFLVSLFVAELSVIANFIRQKDETDKAIAQNRDLTSRLETIQTQNDSLKSIITVIARQNDSLQATVFKIGNGQDFLAKGIRSIEQIAQERYPSLALGGAVDSLAAELSRVRGTVAEMKPKLKLRGQGNAYRDSVSNLIITPYYFQIEPSSSALVDIKIKMKFDVPISGVNWRPIGASCMYYDPKPVLSDEGRTLNITLPMLHAGCGLVIEVRSEDPLRLLDFEASA
jgi:hypothetical protein